MADIVSVYYYLHLYYSRDGIICPVVNASTLRFCLFIIIYIYISLVMVSSAQ